MASPDLVSVCEIYRRVLVEDGTLDRLQQQLQLRRRRGIYSSAVVLWLMILQRLHPTGTLDTAVQRLLRGDAQSLLPSCKRVREGRISAAPGGYCQARLQLPKLIASQVNEHIVETLRQQISQPDPRWPSPILLLDGSSLQLQHSRELVKAYPVPHNQHGSSHWPVLRIVVLHDLGSGMAQCPQWGPMYGPKAVSEQELAEKAIASLPPQAVVMGDANFGIFSMAYAARHYHHPVLLRLTPARAKKLAGAAISQEGELALVWRPSRWDQAKEVAWPADASVNGRLIAWRVGRGKSKSWLYLFTTLAFPAKQIVEMYACRWNIETDLRSLKRTVRLHQLTAKSPEMTEKELLLAFSAYNLVRAVMCMAAHKAGLQPRQLSFSHVLNVVDAAWPQLSSAASMEEHHREFDRVLDRAAQCRLPQRTKMRSFPRTVWRHGLAFPYRKSAPPPPRKTK
jgi:putative transposase